MTMIWKKVPADWVDPDLLGYIPDMLWDKDSRSAVAQINDAYQYGGGFQPFEGFSRDKETGILTYPGDPPLHPLFSSELRDEKIEVYQYGWVCVSQKDGSFQVASTMREWQPKRGEPVWVLLSSSSPRREWYMGVIGDGKMGRFHFPVRIMVKGKWMSRFIWWDSRLMKERENDTQSVQRAGIQQQR